MAYEGRRQVEVGSRENLFGRKMCELHVVACYSFGRLDQPRDKRVAW